MTIVMTDDAVMGEAEQAAVDQLIDAGLLDELMARVDAGELQLTGEGGVHAAGGKRLCYGLRVEFKSLQVRRHGETGATAGPVGMQGSVVSWLFIIGGITLIFTASGMAIRTFMIPSGAPPLSFTA